MHGFRTVDESRAVWFGATVAVAAPDAEQPSCEQQLADVQEQLAQATEELRIANDEETQLRSKLLGMRKTMREVSSVPGMPVALQKAARLHAR